MLGFKIHTVYLTWTRPFQWTLLAFPLPWSTNTAQRDGPRELKDFHQQATTVNGFEEELFLGTIFWWTCVFLFITVVCLIMLAIGYSAARNANAIKDFLQGRPHYAFHRWTQWSIPGVLVTASYTLIRANHLTDAHVKFGYFLAVATFLFMVLGYPTIVFLQLRGKQRQLFQVSFMAKFSCLFAPYKHNLWWFTLVPLFRTLLTCVFIGMLQVPGSDGGGIAAICIISLILLGVVVAEWAVRPYYDLLHGIVDTIVSVINFIILMLMFGQLRVNSERARYGTAITMFVFGLLSVLLPLIAFIDSWLRLEKVRSFKDCGNCCRGKRDRTE